MIRIATILAVLAMAQVSATQRTAIVAAAKKAVPGVTWKADSIVTGDFTCRGHKEQAILGIGKREVVVAVFINGPDKKPEILMDEFHQPAETQLKTESLDYDPKEGIGEVPEGFQRSKVCQGLNINDDRTDSFHVYWNHKSGEFDWWSL
jgi:hypothetical protein